MTRVRARRGLRKSRFRAWLELEAGKAFETSCRLLEEVAPAHATKHEPGPVLVATLARVVLPAAPTELFSAADFRCYCGHRRLDRLGHDSA
jgi:hypothetical protein